MFTKILLSITPILSVFAPVCSTNLPLDKTVFASLMSGNPYRPDQRPERLKDADPENIRFDEAIRVMSFNVHSDDDPLHAWADRKGRVASTIRFHHADIIGVQEPTLAQLNDLTPALSEFSSYHGVTLGKAHDPIFYRKSRFELVKSGYFFLSQTPDLYSIGWDGKYPRATTWVELRDKKTNKSLYFFNTHFEYHGREARDRSASLLCEKIGEIAGKSPYIVSGDFNLFPGLGGDETYKILTDKNSPARLIDAQSSAQFPHHGPTGSWSGFKEAGQPGIKPDFIFVSPQIEVYLHGILADTFDGQFPSDHLPIIADLSIP